MRNKNFKIHSWVSTPQNNLSNRDTSSPVLSENIQKQKTSSSESLIHDFVVKGWTGSSLNSKPKTYFRSLLNDLEQQAKHQIFDKKNLLNQPKIKKELFNLFTKYIKTTETDSIPYTEFLEEWLSMDNGELDLALNRNQRVSPTQAKVYDFLNTFCFFTASFYILKAQLIIKLSPGLFEKPKDLHIALLNPNYFFLKVFQQDNFQNINLKSLKQSAYSWFKPSSEYIHSQLKKFQYLKDISTHEVLALLHKKVEGRDHKILSSNSYSHSLSHESFGDFLHLISFDLTQWPKKKAKFQLPDLPIHESMSYDLKINKLIFTGDYLSSLQQSYYKADHKIQKFSLKNYINIPYIWDKNSFFHDSSSPLYELQVMNYLCDLAIIQKYASKSHFIYNILKKIQNRDHNLFDKQGIENIDEPPHSSASHVVMSLTQRTHENNPYHNIFNQLNETLDKITHSKKVILLSTHNILISSQSSKVLNVSKKAKLLSFFDLSKLQGKGELPSYIYVFEKFATSQSKESPEQLCHHFCFSGELQSFYQFDQFNKIIREFIKNHPFNSPPLFQSTVKDLSFEYFQDALIKGRLINSFKDDNAVTHPSFFKNLINSSRPFNFYFDFKQIFFDDKKHTPNSNFLFEDFDKFSDESKIIIVDKKNLDNIKIEVIDDSQYQDKIYEYGESQCFYFKIKMKWPNIHLDCFEYFYSSSLGRQLINLSLRGDNRKMKSKLAKLLVPKFIVNEYEIDDQSFKQLSYSDLSNHQRNLKKYVQHSKTNLEFLDSLIASKDLETNSQILRFLSHEHENLKTFVSNNFKPEQLDPKNFFNNSLVRTQLEQMSAYAMYPNNEEVFIKFCDEFFSEDSTLSRFKMTKEDESMRSMFKIDLYCEHGHALTIRSQDKVAHFIYFLLSFFEGENILKILYGLQIPCYKDLNKIFKEFMSIKTEIEELYISSEELIQKCVNRCLSQKT